MASLFSVGCCIGWSLVAGFWGSVLVWSSVIVGVGCLAGCLLGWVWSLLADGWVWWVPGWMMWQARSLGRWSSGRLLVLVGVGGGCSGRVLWGLQMRGICGSALGRSGLLADFLVCDRSERAGGGFATGRGQRGVA